MIIPRHFLPIFRWLVRAAKVVAWAIVLLVIAHGLQACKSSKPSQSKFDRPKYDLDRRHPR